MNRTRCNVDSAIVDNCSDIVDKALELGPFQNVQFLALETCEPFSQKRIVSFQWEDGRGVTEMMTDGNNRFCCSNSIELNYRSAQLVTQ